MPSTGNDIVALDLVNKERSNDSRFYSKILSDSEKTLYGQPLFAGMAFDCFVWLCWSVKEAAYKYLKRNQPDLVFSPTRIIITPGNKTVSSWQYIEQEHATITRNVYSGSFTAGGGVYYFRSMICHEMISTIVSEDPTFEHIFWGFGSIDDGGNEHQSKAVRTLLLQRLQTVLPGKKLLVKKAPAGYPVIVEGTKEWDIPVSFAHHGKFVGYSFFYHANNIK